MINRIIISFFNLVCTEVRVGAGVHSSPFYVAPWNPVKGKPIIFKNTLGIEDTLKLIFTSSPHLGSLDITDAYSIGMFKNFNLHALHFCNIYNNNISLNMMQVCFPRLHLF